MSIQEEINRISNAKTDIISAITTKGGVVEPGAKIDDLAESVEGIPSSDPVTPSTYGRIIYYKNKRITCGDLWCESCTAEIVDEDLFSNFMSAQENSEMLDMMYENGTWRVGWMTEVSDPLTEMGMRVELEPGTSFAMISGECQKEYSGRTIYDFEDLEELDGLCNSRGKTIDSQLVDDEAIVDFQWGTETPTEIGDNFLQNCAMSDFYIPDTIVTIGDDFCNTARLDAHGMDITIRNTLQSVGSNFMAYARISNGGGVDGYNSQFTFGDLFMRNTRGFSSIIINLDNKDIPDGFLFGSDFNSFSYIGCPVTIGASFLSNMMLKQFYAYAGGKSTLFKNVVSIGNSFLNNTTLSNTAGSGFQAAWNSSTELESIGTNFLYSSSGIGRISIPASVTSIGSGFAEYSNVLEVEVNTSAKPTAKSGADNHSFTNIQESVAYTRGVLLTGPYAQLWKNSLPDLPSSSVTYAYRKLVLS